MTAPPAPPEGRRSFITWQPHITRTSARLHDHNGLRFAEIDLGEAGFMHVPTAAQARELSAAFASAAMLLGAAEDADAAVLVPGDMPGGAL